MKTIRYIEKTCITCGEKYLCPSRWRRTQWCPKCSDERKRNRLLETDKSARITRAARERGELCEICKNERVQVTHHIVPVSKGGTIEDGYLCLCHRCHDMLHTKHYEYWARKTYQLELVQP